MIAAVINEPFKVPTSAEVFVGFVVVSMLTNGVAEELEIGITANKATTKVAEVETLTLFLNP
jgi:hypothetical protein